MGTRFPVHSAAEQGRQNWPKTAAGMSAAAGMRMSTDRADAAAVIKFCVQAVAGRKDVEQI